MKRANGINWEIREKQKEQEVGEERKPLGTQTRERENYMNQEAEEKQEIQQELRKYMNPCGTGSREET